jgi:hypothetical protein
MRPAELAQLVAERPIAVRLDGSVALGAAVLPDQPARPPLGDDEHPLEMFDGAAPRGGPGSPVSRPSFFRAWIWSSLSATIRFVSSSLSRLTSSAFSPPY